MPASRMIDRIVSASGLPSATCTIVALSCHCPKRPPHAAFAQPVSVTVQWRSPGGGAGHENAGWNWPRPQGLGGLNTFPQLAGPPVEEKDPRARPGGGG